LHGIGSKLCDSTGRRKCPTQFIKNIATAVKQGICVFATVGHGAVPKAFVGDRGGQRDSIRDTWPEGDGELEIF
jgi:hypothetical protein